jgi:hypothetical protein
MRRATPLGHERNAPAPNQEKHPHPTPAETPDANDEAKIPRPFSVVRGGAPGEKPRRSSGEHRRRATPARAVVQPSDPERLRKALEAMREMNKLTRRRTEEMRKLSILSRELSRQMTAFGSVIGNLRIGPERKSFA